MRRRILAPACLFLTACAALTAGCDTLRSSMRKHSDSASSSRDEVEAVESGTDKIEAVDSDEKKPTPFFKNNRLSGAMSDEGREIERSLGVR